MKKLVIAVGVGALVATGLIAVAVRPSEQHESPASAPRSVVSRPAERTVADGVVTPRKLGQPCRRGQEVASIAALRSTVPIWAPAGEQLKSAFLCGDLPTLWYGDVEVWYDDEAPATPADYFAERVARVGGRIQAINGRQAWVHPADADGPRNTVSIIVGKYSVTVVAEPAVGIDRVLHVAGEIDIPESVGR